MKRFGLLGRTLKHSFSKTYFTRRFEEERIQDCVYENFELQTINELPHLLTMYPDLAGLNVTIPYKEEILPYLTAVTDTVKAIGACNCIRIEGGILTGFNTDVFGFQNSLAPKLQPHHKRALVLGTGGGAKAIWYALDVLGIPYKKVSRQKEGADFQYEEITGDLLGEYHLVINTTPLGMYPNTGESPAIPYKALTPEHFMFDIVYNPEKTTFLAEGERQGAQVCNGYEMLIGQAEESWRIWNGENR